MPSPRGFKPVNGIEHRAWCPARSQQQTLWAPGTCGQSEAARLPWTQKAAADTAPSASALGTADPAQGEDTDVPLLLLPPGTPCVNPDKPRLPGLTSSPKYRHGSGRCRRWAHGPPSLLPR